MSNGKGDPVIKKVIQRLTHFDWLSNKRAVTGRQIVLHGIFFLLALVLLAAGNGQLAAHPMWSALILALFGCGYFFASFIFKDPYYVYPTLALWTFAFFLVCFAFGVPPLYFPIVATFLLFILWVAGGIIEQTSIDFATAVYRCMFLTTLFFGMWTRFYKADQHAVTAATFLLYGLSMALFHFLRPRSLFGYLTGSYLALGAFYTAVATGVLTWPQYGAAVQPMVLVILLLAVLEHRRNKFSNAVPHYHTGLLLTIACLFLSLVGGRSLLDQIALMAVSLGFPVLTLEYAAKSPVPAPFNEDTYTKGLFFFAQVSLYVAIPFIIIAPLLSVGHALLASLLLAAFSLYCLLGKRGGMTSSGYSRYLHLTAFFAALSGAWLAPKIFSSRIAPDPIGLSVIALVWLALWLILKGKRSLRIDASVAADCMATIASALVFVGVFRNSWDTTSLVAGLIVFACSLTVLLAEKRLLSWIALGVSAAFIITAIASVGLPVLSQWALLTALAVTCLIATIVALGRGRTSLIFSITALALTIPAISAALKIDGAERSVLFVAISTGVPMALSSYFYSKKRLTAMFCAGLINIVSVVIIIWVGRMVSPVWLGAAILIQVPFLVIGWLISRLWSYAMTTAAALALGLLLISANLFGLNWAFMLVAAALCALFLHGNALFGNNLGKSSVAAIGHAMAVVVVIILYRLVDETMDWRTILSLAVVGGAYLAGGLHNPGTRSIAYLFFSLILLPLTASIRGRMPSAVLVVPAALVTLWALAAAAQRSEIERKNFCRAGALLGLFLCFAAATLGSSSTVPIYILCLIGFIVFLLLQRDRFYVHIVLLSLAMMGYAWIHQTGTHFTQKLFMYLLLVFSLATLAEVLPHLIAYLDRTIPVPFVRLFTWRGALLGALVGVVIAFLYLSSFTLAVTEHPVFCKSCHNMDKFFASWQHSSHKEVACVECHYDPGFSAHLEGKIGAISQLVSFATHRYDSKPHAEVSNAACQRIGCHVTITEDTDVFFQDKVHFDHSIHHDAMVDGRDLPCMTCHHQESQTSHIGITSSTCFLCHFHGNGSAHQKTDDCKTCHGPPDGPITIGEETFTHADFFEGQKDVDCHHCHREINVGDPQVSTVRCQSCHYLEKLSSIDLESFGELHEWHVHDQKVGCFECHGVVRHGVTEKATPQDAQTCNNCHVDKQHSLQAKMYLGTAVPDMPGDPNVMYAAGISCTHCHDQRAELTRGGREFVTHVSTSKNCVSCHGDEYYEELFDMWREDTRSSLDDLEAGLNEVRQLRDRITASGSTVPGIEDVLVHLARAEELYGIIMHDGSEGVHNAIYAGEIIEAAASEIEEARQGLNALMP